MSVTSIPEQVKFRLWRMAAGRCQYRGCNVPLYQDALTQREFNIAYIAHIVADSPEGPRGDHELSPKLKSDIGNLMLLCDTHHRLIDRADISGHPVPLLLEMKQAHERRIEFLTSLQEECRSHIVLYGANIGQYHAQLNYQMAAEALSKSGFYPYSNQPIELGLKNSAAKDSDPDFWKFEKANLETQFKDCIKSRLANSHLGHMSIFALAPMPLLMALGRLLSDIPAAEVYQLHREPQDWSWQDEPSNFDYFIHRPDAREKIVSLNLSLSASIEDSRIAKVLPGARSAWTLTVADPNNDFLKGRGQLKRFRETFRKLLGEIHSMHGDDAIIHLFPAVPVSIAVELGRVWMPKSDLPIKVYDQNRAIGGFVYALDIG